MLNNSPPFYNLSHFLHEERCRDLWMEQENENQMIAILTIIIFVSIVFGAFMAGTASERRRIKSLLLDTYVARTNGVPGGVSLRKRTIEERKFIDQIIDEL